MPKELILFSGPSAVGKSTHIDAVSRFFGAAVLHVGALMREPGVLDPDAAVHEQERHSGALLSGISELMVARIAADRGNRVVLDGFPRSIPQARELLAAAAAHGWTLRMIHLDFGAEPFEALSLSRQLERFRAQHAADPDEAAQARMRAKVARYEREELPAVAVLRDAGVPFAAVSVLGSSIEQTSQKVFSALLGDRPGIDLIDTRFDMLRRAMNRLDISRTWVVSGAMSRVYWNNRFGPPREAQDFDVVCERDEQARLLLPFLQEAFPAERWAVTGIPGATAKKFGVEEADFLSARARNPMVWRRGGFEVDAQEVRVVATPEALHDLRAGVLRFDEERFAAVPARLQPALLREAEFRTRKALEEYPFLRLNGRLAEFAAPQTAATARAEPRHEGGAAAYHWSAGLLPGEVPAAVLLVQANRALAPRVEALPRIARTPLPAPLEELQRRWEAGSPQNESSAPLPPGCANWLHYIAGVGSDAEWREWLLNQCRSRTPIGGRDSFVERVLSDRYLPENVAERNAAQGWSLGAQRESHLGATVYQHHRDSALCLETDQIIVLARTLGVSPERCRELRLGIRIGMFTHDCGKLLGREVTLGAGRHERAGALVWKLHLRPAWMSESASELVSWCIQNHSLLGRLNRSITEKHPGAAEGVGAPSSYPGAVDPTYVREKLALLKLPFPVALSISIALQKADVGSVPALRYLSPAIDLAAEVVRAGAAAD